MIDVFYHGSEKNRPKRFRFLCELPDGSNVEDDCRSRRYDNKIYTLLYLFDNKQGMVKIFDKVFVERANILSVSEVVLKVLKKTKERKGK